MPTPDVSPPRLRVVRLLITLAPLLLAVWVVNQNFLLTPTVRVAFTPGAAGGAVRLDIPEDLVASRSGGRLRWRLARDTVRFSVRVPRAIERLRLRVWLENTDQTLVAVSAQGRRGAGLLRQVLDHDFLNTLSWPRVREGSLTLWQRPAPSPESREGAPLRQFASVQDFLAQPPDLARVGVVGLDPTELFRIPGYRPSETTLALPGRYRGRHALLVYVQSEPLRLVFAKRDLNRSVGADPATISVRRSGVVVHSVTVVDDGNSSADGRDGPAQEVRLELAGLADGLYRIEFEAGEDVVFDRFTTAQRFLAFSDRVFLAGGPAYGETAFQPVRFSVRASAVTVETPHREGLQRVTVNGVRSGLSRVKVPVTVTIPEGTGTVAVERDDVSLAVSGYLAPDPAQRFDLSDHVPAPVGAVDLGLDPKPAVDRLDYILAVYAPRETAGSLAAVLEYGGSQLQLTDGRARFSLQAPGLAAAGRVLRVERIEVELMRGPLPWNRIGPKLKNALTSLIRR